MATSTVKVKYGDTLSGLAKANNTTVQAIMAANPSIKDPNKIYAGSSIALTPTTPVSPTAKSTTTEKVAAPTPMTGAPTQTPTIAERASMIPDAPKTDSALQSYYDEQARMLSTPIDERKLRDEIRNTYNSQFEALRLAAAQKKAEIYKEGENRLGSARATQARSGVLGSNFASAEDNQINKDSVEQARMVDAETDAKIAFLMGQSEQDYSAQIAAAREAKRAGADEYIKFLQTRDSQRTEQVSKLAKLFAAQGIDPKTLSAADVTKLEKTYGVNLDQLNGLITEEKNKINKDAFFELSDGQARYEYDPATGTAKLVAENAKNFAPKSSGGGSGIGGGASGVYANDLDALIGNVGAALNGKYKQDAFKQSIKNARNDQDKIAAIATAVNITGDARQDLTQTAVGQNNLRQAIALLDSGVQTGVIKNGTNYAFNLVGNQVDPQMTKLKQYITAAIQPYRSSVTGAAWGSQEEAEYQSMFGSTKDTPETLKTKLKNLDKIMTNKRVGIVQAYADPLGMNSSFDSYYSNADTQKPAAVPSASDVKVKAKDGRIITIPQTNLSAALKNGYTQVK